jgi:hypothetical protein
MISNGKGLNYKVVDFVESYNFHIHFILSEFIQKVIIFLREIIPKEL